MTRPQPADDPAWRAALGRLYAQAGVTVADLAVVTGLTAPALRRRALAEGWRRALRRSPAAAVKAARARPAVDAAAALTRSVAVLQRAAEAELARLQAPDPGRKLQEVARTLASLTQTAGRLAELARSLAPLPEKERPADEARDLVALRDELARRLDRLGAAAAAGGEA